MTDLEQQLDKKIDSSAQKYAMDNAVSPGHLEELFQVRVSGSLLLKPLLLKAMEAIEFYQFSDNLFIDYCEHSSTPFIAEKSKVSVYNDVGYSARETLKSLKDFLNEKT